MRRVCSQFGSGVVGDRWKRDTALGQCMYAQKQNKAPHTHTHTQTCHRPWAICLTKNSPWKLENKFSFSLLTSLGNSTFFGKMSKFKDTGSLGSLEEKEVEKRQRGVWQRRAQKVQDTWGDGGTTEIISRPTWFACFFHQILFLSCWENSISGLRDLHFKKPENLKAFLSHLGFQSSLNTKD